MKLYEIREEFLRLADMDLDESTMNDTLESLEFELEDKADNIACLIKSLEADRVALENEVDNLTARAKSKAKKADSLRKYLFETMKQLDKSKIETARNQLTVKKNPISVCLDEDFIDSRYMVAKYTPDKARIKEDLQSGKEIPGAWLEQKERLEVK